MGDKRLQTQIALFIIHFNKRDQQSHELFFLVHTRFTVNSLSYQ